jgi:hypothetical protein
MRATVMISQHVVEDRCYNDPLLWGSPPQPSSSRHPQQQITRTSATISITRITRGHLAGPGSPGHLTTPAGPHPHHRSPVLYGLGWAWGAWQDRPMRLETFTDVPPEDVLDGCVG